MSLCGDAKHRRIRHLRFGREPRTLRLPLRPVRGVLGLVEPLLLPLLPLTAGQLASFANDSDAEPSDFMRGRRASLLGLNAMLEYPPVDA